MMIGPRRSGRGTIARIITALIGPANVCNPTLGSLATNFGLQPLIGKQAAIITDARMSGRSDLAQVVERLLSISGEDGQTIDRKHKNAWSGKLPTRFTFISNELPRLADASGALAGRMIVLRFTESFYGREDLGLMDRITPELAGILNWSIAGWRRLLNRGRFEQPKSGQELVEELADLASPVGQFVREECELDPHGEEVIKDLFNRWEKWCTKQNWEHPGTVQTFGRQLRAVVPQITRAQPRRGGIAWVPTRALA
jgi:putative DNA primase/helicase